MRSSHWPTRDNYGMQISARYSWSDLLARPFWTGSNLIDEERFMKILKLIFSLTVVNRPVQSSSRCYLDQHSRHECGSARARSFVKIASDNLPELRTDRHGSIMDQYQLLALVMLKIQDTCCSSRMVGFCVYHVEEFGLFSYFVFTRTRNAKLPLF